MQVVKTDTWLRLHANASGQLVHHLETMTWKIWLTISGVVIAICVIPLIFNLYKYYQEQQSADDADDDSIDEEFVEYLMVSC